MEVEPFALLTSPVIVYHTGLESWDEELVSQSLVDLSVSDW